MMIAAGVEPRMQPRSRWAVCTRCNAQVDTRWWNYGHGMHCFAAELRDRGPAAFEEFFILEEAA